MKTGRAGTLLAVIALLILYTPLSGQHKHKHIHRADGQREIICYYSESVNETYIPPPEAYISRLKSGEAGGATFIFDVQNLPNQDGMAAIEEAAAIWSSLIYSPVPINVRLIFADQGTGTLASTGTPWPPRIIDNNGYLPRRVYVQALAEKFYGINLNGSQPDMTMTFNQNLSWYWGTDGNPGASRYDFLSTLLHEMAHGLGFFGYLGVEYQGVNQDIAVGFNLLNLPGAFDGFLENKDGTNIADTLEFPNPSNSLGDALTSPPVYYNSPLVERELPEETMLPKMYIPTTWRGGNSLYHLDQIYDFKNGRRDALMTYSADRGEAIHDPGPITTYMLYELGWVHTYIQLDTLKDRESLGDPFTVTAKIYGDEGIKAGSQQLYYSFDGFQTQNSVLMTPTGNPDEFKADIPVSGLNTTVSYYIRTLDTYDRVYTSPSGAPDNFYRFFVGPDNTPPSIEHFPIRFMLTSYDSLQVKAEISDNLGIDQAMVEYKINDVDQPSFALEHDTLSDYIGYFVFGEGLIQDGDVIKYRIKAVDASVSQHVTYNPESGYHEFAAEESPPFADNYFNDFEEGIDDFGVEGFYHTKPDGFGSYGMHTEHPYPAWNRENTEMQLTAVLKIPIRLNPGQMYMSFYEIAYIEEGEGESQFGDWNFWDYVIVEGSKDGGQSWHAFTEGWDCRRHDHWFDKFTDLRYQDYDNNLSTAVPSESDRRIHLIDMLAPEEFNDNDVILVRFRLYSDPFFSGWGWAIDDLEIGPAASVQDLEMMQDAISVYPNPSTGYVNVQAQMVNEVSALQVSLYDLMGKHLFTETYDRPGPGFSRNYDLNHLPNGVYMMKFSAGELSVMKKLIITR